MEPTVDCTPTQEKIVMIGDFRTTAGCLPPQESPAQIWISSTPARTSQIQRTDTVGDLKIEVRKETVSYSDGEVVSLPSKGVDISFSKSALPHQAAMLQGLIVK
jgi:hypothetical protein